MGLEGAFRVKLIENTLKPYFIHPSLFWGDSYHLIY